MIDQQEFTSFQGEAAWLELIARYEDLLVKRIRRTYNYYAPKSQLERKQVEELLHKTYHKLMKDDYQCFQKLIDPDCQEDTVKLYLMLIASSATAGHLRTIRAKSNQNTNNYHV